MPIHTLKLKECNEVAKGTKVFVFEKPQGFIFKPGQYGGFTLINPPEVDASGITRRFSILSTPDDDYLAIAIRVQSHSAYKKILNNLPLGSAIKFAGPTGNFVLHEDTNVPAVLIAGGIGITPFYSIIRHATKNKSPHKIFLFYGNREKVEAAFLNELLQYEKENPNFKMIATLDNKDDSWHGETGFITQTMIKKYITDLNTPFYYICGAPVMVTALQEMLAEMDIDEDRIKTEDFPGY